VSPARLTADDLDRLLDDWAGANRLTAREAEEVRVAVVGERPVGLDAGWWSGLMGQVSAAVIQAVALPDSARAALQPASTHGSPAPA
jgi:hypothetical protein